MAAHLVVSGRLAESTAQSAAVGDHRKLEVTALELPQRDDASRICSLGKAAQSGPCRNTWQLSDCSFIHLFFHSCPHPFHHSFVSLTCIHPEFFHFNPLQLFICSLIHSCMQSLIDFCSLITHTFAVGVQGLLLYIHTCTLPLSRHHVDGGVERLCA